MIVGHAPFGYVTSKAYEKFNKENIPKSVIAAGILGSIIPDIDFLFTDSGHNHRELITHTPIFWLVLLFFSFLVFKKLFKSDHALIFSLNGLFHVLLDTILCGTMLQYPLNNKMFSLIDERGVEIIKMPNELVFPINMQIGEIMIDLSVNGALYNFMNHWTFKIEIALWVFASMLFLYNIISRCPSKQNL